MDTILPPSFIADVHLGKLAKWLRMLGFDTHYRNDLTHEQLAAVAKEEGSVLLSRNRAFTTMKNIHVFVVQGKNAEEQLVQVMDYFNLRDATDPFTRCLVCNGLLQNADKTTILNKLLPVTIRSFNEFWQCSTCGHIVWKGSHYERMLRTIDQLGLSRQG